MTLFEDRQQAGTKLSNHLQNVVEVDTVVIPFPEAGEIGIEVAKTQGVALAPQLSEFISAPEVPHANIGAVVEDGTLWIEDGLKNELGVNNSYIQNTALIRTNELKEESKSLHRKKKNFHGKKVLIVSDGLNSGFREAAVAGSLMKEGADKIYVATPFKSRDTMADLESVTDRVFYLKELPFLSSPSACYDENPEESGTEYKKHLPA